MYLNGDGAGKGTHMSLFFVVMKGDYDALLPWPFRHKVGRETFPQLIPAKSQHRKALSHSFLWKLRAFPHPFAKERSSPAVLGKGLSLSRVPCRD